MTAERNPSSALQANFTDPRRFNDWLQQLGKGNIAACNAHVDYWRKYGFGLYLANHCFSKYACLRVAAEPGASGPNPPLRVDGMQLRSADFSGCDVRGINFHEALSLRGARFNGALMDPEQYEILLEKGADLAGAVTLIPTPSTTQEATMPDPTENTPANVEPTPPVPAPVTETPRTRLQIPPRLEEAKEDLFIRRLYYDTDGTPGTYPYYRG